MTTARLYLEDISLGVSTHGSTRDADDKGRERIKAASVAGWLGNTGKPC